MKINGDVQFTEEGHIYTNLKDPTIKYTSVTTLISRYEQPFDKEFTSKYKALERLVDAQSWKKEKGQIWKSHKIPLDYLEVHNIDEKELLAVQQDILDEWEKINREACERGTRIHAQLEQQMYNSESTVQLPQFGIGGKFECKRDYTELDLPYGVYPEYLIYYDNPKLNLHIAGQIDLLIKNGNEISIGDYKTNAKIDTKGFYDSYTRSEKKMLYPLNTLADVNFNHYQLQLSLYAWMIQKLRPEFTINKLIISHYDHDGKNTLYNCRYLKEEVEKMLKHFAKEQRLEAQRNKYKRIEY